MFPFPFPGTHGIQFPFAIFAVSDCNGADCLAIFNLAHKSHSHENKSCVAKGIRDYVSMHAGEAWC